MKQTITTLLLVLLSFVFNSSCLFAITIHVARAGTLPSFISESQKYYIEELTLTGVLNGTDFRLLRDMAGNNYLGQNTSGNLKILDLTNAKIVAGGDKYLIAHQIQGDRRPLSLGYGDFNCGISRNDEIPDFVFCGCHLNSILLPNTLKNIRRYAFAYCRELTSITIPNSIIDIQEGVFSDCSGLASISIPNSVTTIDNFAFSYCSSLTSITIPNSVTSIGVSAFSGCSGLTSITIPNSVTRVSNAFSSCNGLISINVESGNTVYDSRNGCNAIIETSTNCLVAGCKNTTIPNSVTSIGGYAFCGCSGLTSITIPNSVISIGGNAFENCSGLTSITIPNSVTSIGNSAFAYCSGLTSITIPNSVTSIGERAFYASQNLISIVSEIVNPFEINDNTFSNYSTATLTVPNGTKSKYQATNYWNKFTNIVESDGGNVPYSNDNNQLVVDDISTSKGKPATLYIGLGNETTDLSAYQFDLTLPAGFTLSKNDKGKFLVSKTDRYEDVSQTLNVSDVEGNTNTYRFVCFSLSNSVIEGTSGAILNAVIDAANNVEPGTYEAQISDVIFTRADGTQLQLNSVKFNIVVNNVIKGDANDDGEINVADIVEVVNYILGKPSAKFVEAAADLNDDGEINVTDIVKIVSIIMSTNNARLRAPQVEATDRDRLTLSENESRGLSLCLDNEDCYVASQFDIHLSDGQTLEGIRLNNIRSNEHVLTYSKTDDNTYRVIIYSLGNQTYAGNSGELLSIQVSGTGNVDIDNILFVTSGQNETKFNPLHSYTTGINAVEEVEKMDVYTIDGRLLGKQVKSTNDLEKGVYIINGKKQVIR